MLDRFTVTHHVPGDTWAPPRTRVRALCGASIPVDETTRTPSCPICRQRLRRLDQLDAVIDKGLFEDNR